MAQFIVGLTGGIGSGKSTVASLFKELGVTVVDADWAARAVVEPGTPALKKIADHFGVTILDATGALNRQRLRDIVFNQPEKLRWLEQLLHPLIRDWLQNALANAGSKYAILESPLLFEIDQHLMVDRTLVVDVPESTQLERAAARDGQTIEQIQKIMAKQLSRQARVNRADDTIDNAKTLESTKRQVAKLHYRYLQLIN